MSVMESFKGLFKPYEEDDFSDYQNPAPRKEKVRPAVDVSKTDNVKTIHTTTKVEVVVSVPESYDDVLSIADHLLERRTVVLNLEKANKEAVRRLLDFLSGVAFAQGGKVKPISKGACIITPYNVDIIGNDLIVELESNGFV